MKELKFAYSSTPQLAPVGDIDDSWGKVRGEAPFTFTLQTPEGEFAEYTVARGFVSDGASIPRFFWRLLGGKFTPKAWHAFIIHDWCYEGETDLLREDADELLRQVLVRDGYSRFKARLIYHAVRMFGKGHWREA